MARRQEVLDLRRFLTDRLRDVGFTKDRAGRDNEVVVASWRKIRGGRLRTLLLNDWDPWGEGRLTASYVDVQQAESWWASRVPMTAKQMTPGDVDFAIQRGVEGATRELELGPGVEAWRERAQCLIDWLEAAP